MPTPTRRSIAGPYGRAKRVYSINGRDYPSVTSVLSAIAKPALVGWAAKLERESVLREVGARLETLPAIGKEQFLASIEAGLGPQAHTKELTKAGDIGTAAHARIEWQMRAELELEPGLVPTLSEESRRAYDAWSEWRLGVELEPIKVEQVVHSERYGYAGTLDLLGWMDMEQALHACEEKRGRTVFDWKTGKAIYPEALLQCSAYAHAALEMGMTEPHLHGCVVRLPKTSKDPKFEARFISCTEMSDLFPVFLAVLDLWNWLENQK